jgi:hypothetical protein
MNDHMKILKQIEDGEITPEEGARLLRDSGTPPTNSNLELLARIESGESSVEEILSQFQPDADPSEEDASPESAPPVVSDEEMNRWRRWWNIPFYIGIGVVVLSSLWLNSAYQNSGYGFWFFCAWFPLALGLLFMALAWNSRKGPWIHVRVDGPKERVAVSIPAPLGLTSWALNTFGSFIPHLDKTSIDEILLALDKSGGGGNPFYVHVEDGDDGEKVQVFIG